MIVSDVISHCIKEELLDMATYYLFLIKKGYVNTNDNVNDTYQIKLNDVEKLEYNEFKTEYIKNFANIKLYTSKFDTKRYHLVFAENAEQASVCVNDLFGKIPFRQIDITDRKYNSFIDQHGNDVHLALLDIITYPYYVGLFNKETKNIRVPYEHKHLYQEVAK